MVHYRVILLIFILITSNNNYIFDISHYKNKYVILSLNISK